MAMTMKSLLIATMMLPVSAMASGLQLLDDSGLSEVTGQEGISLRLELMINSDSAGNPLTASTPGSLIDCSHVSDPCRYAMEFQGRANKWLVFKGYSGILKINDLLLNAEPSLANAGSNAAYWNASKFQGLGGVCLLPNGVCSTAALDSQPGMRVSYPTSTPGYNPASFSSSGFDSLSIGIRLSGIAVEHGANGFIGNANTPFLGFNVRDLNGPSAAMAIGGSAYVFGF